MAKPTIVTRSTKGSALTWTEGDANITNLRDATIGITDGTTSGTLDLNDTLTFTAGSNITLGYNASTKALTITGSGGGATTLDELSDVVITAAATDDILRFDGTNWVDTPLSSVTVGVASTVTITVDNSTNATNFPLFVDALAGNEDVRTDLGFTYNPSTGVLTATQFAGTATQTLLGSSNGNGSNPNTYLVIATSTSTSVGQQLHIDSANLTWDASQDVLEVGNSQGYFSGNIGVSPASARAARFTSLQFTNPIEPTYTLTYGATITPNATNGSVQKVTLTGNVIFSAFTSPVAGQSMTVIFVQDATGSRTLTSTMKWSGGIKTLSTAANAIDIATVYYDGTNYYASLAKGFA